MSTHRQRLDLSFELIDRALLRNDFACVDASLASLAARLRIRSEQHAQPQNHPITRGQHEYLEREIENAVVILMACRPAKDRLAQRAQAVDALCAFLAVFDPTGTVGEFLR